VRADGHPAEGALAVLLEPELDSARVGADGVAHLHAVREGPLRFQAFLPGHRILAAGPLATLPPGGFRFKADRAVPLEKPVLEVRRDRRLRLEPSVPDLPLPPGLLVTAVPAEDPGQPPWLGLGDPQGGVLLTGTRPVPLQVSVFAPGLPPAEPWRLARRELGPADGLESVEPWAVPFAQLVVAGLPFHVLLTGERLSPSTAPPDPLPLRWSGERGEVIWACLPPGRYRFRSVDQARTITLKPGTAQLDFGARKAAPEENKKNDRGDAKTGRR